MLALAPDVEVAQVRRLARDGDLDPGSAGTALADLTVYDPSAWRSPRR